MRIHGTATPAGKQWLLSGRESGSGGSAVVSPQEHRETDAESSAPVHDRRGPERSDQLGAQSWKDRPARWLTAAMLALAVLAAAAAVVSFSAQYRMVHAAKGTGAVAALEAGIPDVAALIFATLGIALALHGKRAVRARFLNIAAVATSVAMNVLAAGHGWRDLAIWAMPPVAYALASDTAIGVSLRLVNLMLVFSLVRWHEDGYSFARQMSGTCLGGISGG